MHLAEEHTVAHNLARRKQGEAGHNCVEERLARVRMVRDGSLLVTAMGSIALVVVGAPTTVAC